MEPRARGERHSLNDNDEEALRETRDETKHGQVKQPKRNGVNKACRNIISPDRAASVTTTANNEPDFISRADW